jgi:flagellar hook protein FlgE
MASNALFAGVSALQSYQDMLNVIGNDLANVNTTAYKSQRTRFGDLLYQTLAEGSSSQGVGEANPQQVGFGVGVQAIDQNMSQGTLQATGNNLDLALSGNGMFVVNNGVQNLFTRSGAFNVDPKGFLVDSTTGYRVQRFGQVGEGSAGSQAFQINGDNNIRIPFGTGIPGKTTTNVNLQGNLSASALGPLAQTLTSAQAFTTGTPPAAAQLTTQINALSDGNGKYKTGDQIVISGTRADGTAVPANTALTLTVGGPNASTMQDLINTINAAYNTGNPATSATASLDASGNLVLKANSTGPANGLSLTLADAANNTGSTNWANHIETVTTTGKNGDSNSSAIQVFDTQGTAHTLSLTFQKQADGTWTLTGSIPPGDGTMIASTVTGITFNDDGSFRGAAGAGNLASMSFQIKGLSKPQTFTFNFGSVNGFNGLTQFGGNSSAAAVNQDGFAAGFLNNLSIGQDGTINGIFTNGQTLPIAQLAVAQFSNPGGLDRVGNNYFSLSASSGTALIGTATSGGRGTISQGTLESSNVDVAGEFTQLIVAQRGFQVNAKTITVNDQVLQDLVNILQ